MYTQFHNRLPLGLIVVPQQVTDKGFQITAVIALVRLLTQKSRDIEQFNP